MGTDHMTLLFARHTVRPELPLDRYNKSFIGLDLSRPFVKSPHVYCTATTGRFLLGVWKQRMRAQCLGQSNANGPYHLHSCNFLAQPMLLRRFHRYAFWPRPVSNCAFSSPTLSPGSSYSWNRKRFVMPVLWIPAYPRYLYVSLASNSSIFP